MGSNEKQFLVDLQRNWCNCESWSLTGVPCVHSIASLHKKGLFPHDKIDNYYKVEIYVALYDNLLMSINGKDMYPRGEGVFLDPPNSLKQPRRLKKARKT